MSGIAPGSLATRSAANVPERALSIWWPVGAVLAVLYGSLIPFTFDGSLFGAASNEGGPGLQFRGTTWEDLFTNVAVYLPIGITVVFSTICVRLRPLSRVILAAFLGFGVSIFAETLQVAMAVRVASLTDVVLNVLGATCGAVLGLGFRKRTIGGIEVARLGLSANPSQTLAKCLTVGLVLFALVPFDFVLDTAALHESFRVSRWDLGSLRGVGVDGSLLESVMRQLTTAAWFAVLCYLFAKARLSSGATIRTIWLSAVRHGMVLAGLIELLQLFTRSHNFDLSSLLLRTLASGFGAWCAVLVPVAMRGPFSSNHRRLAIRTPVLVGLCAFQIASMQLSCVDTDLFTAHSISLSSVCWLPFEALWHRPVTSAGAQVLETLLAYGTLAASLGIVLRRAHIRRVWIITGAAVIWVALTVEMLQLAAATGTADVTDLLLALAAVVVVSQAFSILKPVHLSPLEVAPSRVPMRPSMSPDWKSTRSVIS